MITRSPPLTRQRALNLRTFAQNQNAAVEEQQRQQQVEGVHGGNEPLINAPISPRLNRNLSLSAEENEHHFSEMAAATANDDEIRRRLLHVSIQSNLPPRANGGGNNGAEQQQIGREDFVEGLREVLRPNFGNLLVREEGVRMRFVENGTENLRYEQISRNLVRESAPNTRHVSQSEFIGRTSTPVNFHGELQNFPIVSNQNRQREIYEDFGPYREHENFRTSQIQTRQQAALARQQQNANFGVRDELLPCERQHNEFVGRHLFEGGRRMMHPTEMPRQMHQQPPREERGWQQQNSVLYRPVARQQQNFPAYENQMLPPQSQNLAVLSSLEYNMVLERIPDLNGKEGTDEVKRFFKKFDAYTDSWPDEKRIKGLESKVYGRAERAFEAAKAVIPIKYELLRGEMTRQLEETDSKNLNAFDELMLGVRRKPNESIDDLAGRISGLVKRAYPGLSFQLSDEFSIKYLIRSIGDPTLSLNLELIRTPRMSLDHFVSLAARAESTQRATQRFVAAEKAKADRNETQFHEPRRNFNREYQRQPEFQPNFRDRQPEFQPNNGPIRQNNPSFEPKLWKCYNCNEVGHISRNCPRPKQFEANAQNKAQTQPGNLSNKTFGNSNRNLGSNKPNSSNFLRQNCIVEQQESVTTDVRLGKIEIAPEVDDFLGKIVVGRGNEAIPPIGKVMVVKTSTFGVETDSMLDGGAQISLISANFLYQLVKEKNLNFDSLEPSQTNVRVLDVNGKMVPCLFKVNLPILRRGLKAEVKVAVHVTKAPIGFDMLIGTNGLGKLGFKLYDEANDSMVEFENSELNSKNLLTVIYGTTIEPRSTKILEMGVNENYEASELLISSDNSNDLHVEPTVAIANEGKIIVPVTNRSHSKIALEKGQQIGEVEPIFELGESDDMLISPVIVSMLSEPNGETLEKQQLLWETVQKNVGFERGTE
ncbi:hypothetical protein niasHT_011489 [Heterodera trifolii]|uniref:CCHC-type domain-containing protein n=1 Tax=Heterodera trifolii TaxID=157864 RepID=A0ABD2L3A1_9BILA